MLSSFFIIGGILSGGGRAPCPPPLATPMISGLSSQGSAHGRSQEFGFETALKRKFQSHGGYVLAEATFSERSPRNLNK